MRSSAEPLDDAVRAHAAALLGRPIVEVTRVRGGANSRVYRVSDGTTRYALKLYPVDPADKRDRLGAESMALRFLRGHGVRTVPDVIAIDTDRRMGLFEWIEGASVENPRAADILTALGLLEMLHRLRGDEAAAEFPMASEACLSGLELTGQIVRRFSRLEIVAKDERALAEFLSRGVAPAFDAARSRAQSSYADGHLDFQLPLEAHHRSLSPSDFGFHNALRRPDDGLSFLDFEYFGWDDPVKPVADFVLHPGMTLTEAQRRDFVAGALRIYGADDAYELRLRALLPLYALRWSLILLNEFLPERWAHRVEAGVAVDREMVLAAQLVKAQALLGIANKSIACFPYGD